MAIQRHPDMNRYAVKVRPARSEDAPALARIHVDSWRAAYCELVPESVLLSFNHELSEERFRESLAMGAEETLVVQLDHEIAGFLILGTARDADLDDGHTGEIWGIYIAPDCWRRGIGRRLVAEAEKILISREYERAVLWVLDANRPARRFFEAMGFSPDGASKEIDWGTPLRVVRYTRPL